MTILTNILAINLCYHIPVKLFSFHLLLVSIIIAIPYTKHLLRFFFGGNVSVLPKYQPIVERSAIAYMKLYFL